MPTRSLSDGRSPGGAGLSDRPGSWDGAGGAGGSPQSGRPGGGPPQEPPTWEELQAAIAARDAAAAIRSTGFAAPTIYEPARPPEPRRRGRGLWYVGVVVALVLLIGGSALAAVSWLRVPAPAAVVRNYFAAIRAGDAAKALSFGVPPSGVRTYLTSEVLSAQRALGTITAVSVGATRISGASASVDVSYEITSTDGNIHRTERLALAEHSRRWLLQTVAAPVTVALDTAAHRATFAGVALPQGQILLFPGRIPVEFDTPNLQQDPTSDVVTLGSSGPLAVHAALSPAGTAAVTSSLESAMRTCLTQGAAAPVSCPLTPDAGAERLVPDSLRGTLTSTSMPSSPTLVPGNADGVVQASGDFTVSGSWTSLTFNNLATTQKGKADVSFTATLSVTAPATVVWGTS